MRFRKIFTRYDNLNYVFSGFIFFAIIIDAVISVNTMLASTKFVLKNQKN